MKYRVCEKCKKILYSTGKDYEDVISTFFDLSMFEMKGLCPFCNPKSRYFITEENKKFWAENRKKMEAETLEEKLLKL